MTATLRFHKWVDFLTELEYNSIRGAKKATGITDSHAYTLARLLAEKGLIIIHKEGRSYTTIVTKQGKKVIDIINQLKKEVKK